MDARILRSAHGVDIRIFKAEADKVVYFGREDEIELDRSVSFGICEVLFEDRRTVWEKCCALNVENGFFFADTFCGSM